MVSLFFKMLMKLTAGILLLLILFSSFYYYGYFNVLVFHVKEEAKESGIANEKAQRLTLIKIPLTKKEQYSGDEIWYNNKLYDVVETKIINDTLYKYLYHDQNEENVLSEINNFFKSDDDGFLLTSFKTSFLKKAHKIPDQLYTFNQQSLQFKYILPTKTLFSKNRNYPAYLDAEVLTPPPRIFSSLI
jgi:hypothetical protein